MGLVRVVVPPSSGHLQAVAAHVRTLQEGGNHVLYVTADRPYRTLVPHLVRGGVDPERLYVLDAVSCLDGGVPAERPANALFLQSPTMLEMMAMRVAQVTARPGLPWCVVVDSLNTLTLYNGEGPVHEFAHYLANRLRGAGVPGNLIVRDSPEGRALRERIAHFTDEHVEIAHAPAPPPAAPVPPAPTEASHG